MEYSFTCGGKSIIASICDVENKPIIYLNTVKNGSIQVLQILRNICNSDFSFVAIDNLEWYKDMSPWNVPSVFGEGNQCINGADDYLDILTNEIIPEVESHIPGKVSWRGLAGYSLAGLFALYVLYQTGLFSRVASISGSFWIPKSIEYLQQHSFVGSPECVYLSLGDTEAETENPYLSAVWKNTQKLYQFLCQKGIDAVFQLNSGGHHDNAAERTARGIAWLVERKDS